MEKCGEPKLDKAGECFSLARCYKSAAEAYAKGNYFSEWLYTLKEDSSTWVRKLSSSGN